MHVCIWLIFCTYRLKKKKKTYANRMNHPLLFVKQHIDIARLKLPHRVSAYTTEDFLTNLRTKQETGLSLSDHPIHLDFYEYFFIEYKQRR